ncbi:MAG: hypothetical protein JOY62_07955 [Acidobacteriaceae bacterium]|nr:hypothetical protein [Acidobacteriaceae bacterium]MBV9779894.1 hypothetical protein [Acidobacteriaceae bacterium]
MKTPFRTAAYFLPFVLLAASPLVYAQNSATNGWPRVDDPQQQQAQADQNQPSPTDQNLAPAPGDNQPNYNHSGNNQQPDYNQPTPPPDQSNNNSSNYDNAPDYQIPAQLTIKSGTFITVRVNQMLSSDKNQAGDAFTATLVRPIVVDGIVVAEPGQTLAGRVVEAKKAGRVEGVARLGVQLTDITLVDGQQVSIQSQLISRSGPTSVGRDAAAIAGTTALGAAIGAAADWGRGAAIGAGAGALVATVGVLVTRGRPSVIYPEQILTFRIEAPITFSTANSQQAFRYVEPNEYDQNNNGRGPQQYAQNGPAPPPYYGYNYGYPYPYYGYPYPYYAYGYPYYWGPGFGFYFGPGYWWGGHYYRGYYGRGFYGRGGFGGRGFEGRGFVGRGGIGGFAGSAGRGSAAGVGRGSAGGFAHGGGGARR